MDIFALVMVTCSWLYTDITLGSPTENSKKSLLVLGGSSAAPPQNIKQLFEAFPVYRTIGEKFAKAEYAEIGPRGLLYAQQRELAAAHPSDKNVQILGSDDATTCIVAILRHSGSGAAAVGHFDGMGGDDGARAMVDKVTKLTPQGVAGRLELSLVGGVLVSGNTADEVFSDMIYGFQGQKLEIDLVLAFIGKLNTFEDGATKPLFYGAGIRLESGQIFPATFSDKGPDQALRATRTLTGAPEMLDVYDNQIVAIKIGPFDYMPMMNIKYYLGLDDQALLRSMSTTPAMEPPKFCEQLRAALKFQLENPNPLKTVFKNNQPHYFRPDSNGLWSPVQAL